MAHSHSEHSNHKHLHDEHDEPQTSGMTTQRKLLWVSFLLISTFMLVEAVGGWLTGSLALLSDAGHMLSDAVALGATLLAFKIGEKSATAQKTFGYKRFEILVAGANGATLIIIALMICIEAFERIQTPSDIASLPMLMVAGVGLVINLVVAKLLHQGGASPHLPHSHAGHHHGHGSTHHDHDHDHDHDHENNNQADTATTKNLNLHSAYLHVLGDLLGSVAAILAALAMMWFGWWWADPVVSVLVAVLILISGYRVVRQSAHILMEGTPNEVDLDEVEARLLTHDAVRAVHDVHIWTITSGLHAMSCHVVVDGEMSIQQGSELIGNLKHRLATLGITHTTIQIESASHPHTFSHIEAGCDLTKTEDKS